MASYAANTDVAVEKTEMDIKRLLRQHGADSIVIGSERERAVIMFEMHERRVRFTISIPPVSDFLIQKRGAVPDRRRSPAEMKTAQEQAQRQRWRVLYLLIKGKLEALANDVEIFEQEFLAYIVLPDNSTVGDWAHEQLEASYRSGQMPPLLPAPR